MENKSAELFGASKFLSRRPLPALWKSVTSTSPDCTSFRESCAAKSS